MRTAKLAGTFGIFFVIALAFELLAIHALTWAMLASAGVTQLRSGGAPPRFTC